MKSRAHGKAWNEFSAWCRVRGLKPLPAHAWTVAVYVRWCETRHELPVIVENLKAIARRHLIAGHPDPERHPMVRRTLAMMERRMANRHRRSNLFDDSVVLDRPGDGTPRQASARRSKTMRSTPKLVRRRRPG